MTTNFKNYKAALKQPFTTKKWDELTQSQKDELIKQMDFHKVPKSIQKNLKYQITEDGTVRGYIF